MAQAPAAMPYAGPRPAAAGEAASRAGPELLARAFNAAPDGFVLIDAGGTIVAANHALEAMFGHPEGSLVGASVETLLPGALREAHIAHRARFVEHPEPRAMGAGRVLYGRRSDGHEFPLEIGLNPLPSPQGLLVLASVVDISERLALEWAFRGLFDASPYGLLIVDDDGIITMVNPRLADALGYTPAALAGRPLAMLLPERYRARHDALTAGYRATGETRVMGRGRDLTALHADGTELAVEIGLSRVRWQRRTVTLAAITDISLRKRLELELRQANTDLEEFSYVASHDLRSPLRGIADLVEWIGTDLGDAAPSAVQRNLQRIRERIARMDRLMDDLLRYARAGRSDTEYATVELKTLVRGILEMQPLPPAFVLDLDVAVEPFVAKRTPLETTLRNLLANAVKHHDREAGRIRVAARHDDTHCEIQVEDDGPGVPGAAQERVFKLFQTANERSGSGIGLALAKRIAEMHGGAIALASPLEGGRGCRFTLRWPRFARRTSDG